MHSRCFTDSLRKVLDATEVYSSYNSVISTGRPQVLQAPNKWLG